MHACLEPHTNPPSLSHRDGDDSLPFFDVLPIEIEEIDLVLITHFHLDHRCPFIPLLHALYITLYNPLYMYFYNPLCIPLFTAVDRNWPLVSQTLSSLTPITRTPHPSRGILTTVPPSRTSPKRRTSKDASL